MWLYTKHEQDTLWCWGSSTPHCSGGPMNICIKFNYIESLYALHTERTNIKSTQKVQKEPWSNRCIVMSIFLFQHRILPFREADGQVYKTLLPFFVRLQLLQNQKDEKGIGAFPSARAISALLCLLTLLSKVCIDSQTVSNCCMFHGASSSPLNPSHLLFADTIMRPWGGLRAFLAPLIWKRHHSVISPEFAALHLFPKAPKSLDNIFWSGGWACHSTGKTFRHVTFCHIWQISVRKRKWDQEGSKSINNKSVIFVRMFRDIKGKILIPTMLESSFKTSHVSVGSPPSFHQFYLAWILYVVHSLRYFLNQTC